MLANIIGDSLKQDVIGEIIIGDGLMVIYKLWLPLLVLVFKVK